jgi:hypothetical protein
MRDRWFRTLVGASLLIILGLPSSRTLLEGSMATHMLVQIPLLAVAGALASTVLPAKFAVWLQPFNRHGATGIVLATVTVVYWMVPLNLDSALSDSIPEMAKFITLPVVVGMVGALSWDALPGVAKGLILAQMISMLDVVAWLYHGTPTRLCTYYLIDQQVLSADFMYLASALLAIGCVISSLFRSSGGTSSRDVPSKSVGSTLHPAGCAMSDLR